MQLVVNILAGIGLAAVIVLFVLFGAACLGLLPAAPEDPSSPYFGDDEDCNL